MDNPGIGSLNSLADYGLGESDIEDSDDEVENKDNQVKAINIVARPYVAQARVTSSKLSAMSVVKDLFLVSLWRQLCRKI